MTKIRLIFSVSLVIVLASLLVLSACSSEETTTAATTTGPTTVEPTTLYIGGTFSLTGAYAEDTAAVLAGFQDYAKYVNDTKMMAPWRTSRGLRRSGSRSRQGRHQA